MPPPFRFAFPDPALAVAVGYELSCLRLATCLSDRTATPKAAHGSRLQALSYQLGVEGIRHRVMVLAR